MKDKLLAALKSEPVLRRMSTGFLDDLAEDLQAVVIRSLKPADGDSQITDLENRVTDVWVDQFGVTLFNAYGNSLFPGKVDLPFSARRRVVMGMIQTMLLEQDNFQQEKEPPLVTIN